MIIKRAELEELLDNDRLLLFGRRKTGKTFYTLLKKRNWTYAIVRDRNSVLVGDTIMDVRTFIKYAENLEKLILDEFHRADPLLLDALQAHKFPEKTVLLTSTLHLFRNRGYSKIFGLFPEYQVRLISPKDILSTIEPKKEVFESALFWQEPTQAGKDIRTILQTSTYFVRSLVGEVLMEEDLNVAEKLNAILSATAGGETKLTHIAGELARQGAIRKAETGLVSPYISMAIKVGLLEKIPIHGSKRSLYRHVSPLTDLIFLLDKRYGIFDRALPIRFLERVFRNVVSRYVEIFCERLFAEIYGLSPVRILKPEVDFALARFRRLWLVGEVKWKNRIGRKELKDVEEKLFSLKAEKYVLIVPEKAALSTETDLEVLDVEDLARLAREPETP